MMRSRIQRQSSKASDQLFCVRATYNDSPFGTPRPVQAFHPGPAVYPMSLPLGILSPVVIWRRRVGFAYRNGRKNPTGVAAPSLIKAVSPAHNGATALVPPTT